LRAAGAWNISRLPGVVSKRRLRSSLGYWPAASLWWLLHMVLGWWWADPVAALVMTPIIAREGVQGLRGHGCDDGDCAH
jgi:hypothetical protein